MILIFFLGVFLMLICWHGYFRNHWKDRLKAELSFAQSEVYAGEQTELIEKIENHKRLPIPSLEVTFQTAKGIVFSDMENTKISDSLYKRDIFSVLGNQRITRRLPLDCMKRGCYRIDSLGFASYSLFYGEKYMTEQPVEAKLYVYARRTDVSGLLLTCEKMAGAIQCAKRIYEDPFAFSGIREYTRTDPMKSINWKASARTGSLMVNTFESTQKEKVMIYLDVQDDGIIRRENRIEEGISVAASLAQKMIKQGMETGIALNMELPDDGNRLQPRSGTKQLTAIERLLASVEEKRKTVEFGDILKDLQEDTLPVFISSSVANQEVIERFLGKGTQGIWVYCIGSKEECKLYTGNELQLHMRRVAGE